MKKYNVFKVISISILITIILSFLIPSTTFDSYGSATTGNINPVSFIDTFANGITSFSVFLNIFIYILCIGILYFVLRKTGKYNDVINNTAYKFKNRKNLFIILSILMFGIVTAIVGDMMPMLVFVPLFIDILIKLGFNKYTAILSTIGSIILGSTGSLYTNYTNQILQATVTDNIVTKIIILVISLGSLIIFNLFLSSKPSEVKLEETKTKNGKGISIAFDIILFFILIGLIPWSSYFGFNGFSDFYETITDFKIFNVSVFKAIIGSNISALGQWNLFDLSILILIISLVISLVYKFKFDDLLETIAEAIKKTIPYALILVLANVVLVNVYNSGFFYTILVNISKMSDKLFSGILSGILSAFVYPDYMYASQFSLSSLTATITDTKFYLVLAVIFQSMYSLFLLIMPTSVLVLLGLRYTNGSYKTWFKHIVKYFLVLFIILTIVLMILGNKYVNFPTFILLGVSVVLTVLSVVFIKNNKEVVIEPKKEIKQTNTKEEEKKETTKKTSASSKKQTTKKAQSKPKTTSKKTNTKSKK